MVKRRIVQTLSLIGLHASWGPEAKWFCNPVLSCHSCVLSWFACPIGVFVHYSGYHLFPYMAVGMVLLMGALFGRLLCGWVCPFGFLMDLLYKIPSPKFQMPRWTGYIKYFVFVAMVIVFPYFLTESTLLSFCRICPAAAIQVTIPNLIMGGFTTISTLTIVKFVVLAGVLVLAVLSSRSFCKVFCPIAAILAPLNLVSYWAVKPPVPACENCQRCDRYCPTDCLPSARIKKQVPPNRDTECIVCHDCQETCPHKECPAAQGEA